MKRSRLTNKNLSGKKSGSWVVSRKSFIKQIFESEPYQWTSAAISAKPPLLSNETSMALTGQIVTHSPQPLHFSGSKTTAISGRRI
jgi:hypothetical protein